MPHPVPVNPESLRGKLVGDSDREFTLKFDGKPSEVDAATLGASLLNVTTIIQEVNSELHTGQKLEIKVRGTAPGSFLVHLGIDPAQATDLLQHVTPENIKLAGAAIGIVISTVAGVFKIRQVLKGKAPKELSEKGDEVHIVTNDGNSVTFDKRTYNVYINNPKVNESVTKTFKALDADPSVTGFEILDKKEQPLVEIPREEFPALTAGSGVPLPERQAVMERTKLHIIKLSFEKGFKWELLYKGFKISAALEDSDFYSRIDRGESFAKGDVLDVELEIGQVFDPSINAYENKNYAVKKVIEYIPRAKQTSLFPDEQSERRRDISSSLPPLSDVVDERIDFKPPPDWEQKDE